MLEKRIIPYSGTGYSTHKESPLWKMIDRLNKALGDIDTEYKDKTSLEAVHSKNQLKAVQNFFKELNKLIQSFTKGSKPGVSVGSNILALVNLLPAFYTPAYALFNILGKPTAIGTIAKAVFIKQNYIDQIEAAFEKIGQKSISDKNINDFRKELKKQFKDNVKANKDVASQIPGYDKKAFLEKLNSAIDAIEFEKLFNDKETKDQANALEKTLTEALFNTTNQTAKDPAQEKYKKYHFQILDQYTYDFAMQILTTIALAPADFKSLASFFNPEAIDKLGIGWLGEITLIEDDSKEKTSKEKTSNYAYLITGALTGNMKIDLAADYAEFTESFSTQLAEEIVKFRENNPDSPKVHNELAKTQLIGKYIEQERKLVEASLNKIEIGEDWLSKEIKEIEEMEVQDLKIILYFLKQSQSHCALLKQKIENYDNLNFAELIKDEADLCISLTVNGTKGFDTTYQTKPLPEILIFKNDGNKIAKLNVRNYIFSNKMKSFKSYQEKEEQYLQKIKAIEPVLKPKMQDLSRKEIEKHQNQNDSYKKLFEQIVSKARASAESENYLFPENLEQRIQYLEQEKQKLTQQMKALDISYQEVQALQDKIRNQSKDCPLDLSEWDPAILQAISSCYEPSRAQAEQCIGQLKQISASLEANSNKLEQELNKVKASIALSKTMQSSDPTSIRKLKEDQQKVHTKLLADHAQLLKAKADNDALAAPDKAKTQAVEKTNEACKKSKNEIVEKLAGLIDSLIYLSKKADNMFDETTFQTVEGTKKVRIWLEKILKKYEGLLNTPGKNYHIGLSEALDIVQTEIVTKPNHPHLFEQLRHKLYPVFKMFFWQDGFDEFLHQAEFTPEERKIWESYISSPPIDFATHKQNLVKRIEEKRKEMESNRALSDKLKTYKQYKSAIEQLKNLLIQLETQTTAATEKTAIYEKELQEKTIAFHLKNEDLSEKIAKNEKEQKTLQSSIDIFDHIENIMINNQQLGIQTCEIENIINENKTPEKLNQTQERLTHLFEETRLKILGLEKSLESLEEKIPNDEKKIYTDYIAKLKQLIASNKNRIADSKNEIFKILEASSLSKIAEIVTCLTKINAEADLLLAPFKPDEKNYLGQIINQISNLNALSLSINNALEKKARLFKELSFETTGDLLAKAKEQIGDAEVKAQANKESIIVHLGSIVKLFTDKLTTELTQNSNLIKDNVYGALTYLSNFPLESVNILKGLLNESSPEIAVLNGINTEFEAQVQRVMQRYSGRIKEIHDKIEAIRIDKTKSNYEFNQDKIKKVCKAINRLPRQLPAQFEALENQINELEANYTQKKAAHDLQGSRISERQQLLTNYTKELDKYVVARASRFFSDDKDNRGKFIISVKKELDSYLESANSEKLNEILKTSFPGYNFKPILNRLKIDLKVQNQPVEKPNAEEAAGVLGSIKNQELREKFAMLFAQSKEIKSFANSLDNVEYKKVANRLADSLTQEINQFLVKNKACFKVGSSSEARLTAFSKFQEDFTCLLNSQNDVLSQHVTWGPILANIGLILLAVCTAGISLGAQAIVQNVYNRDSLWVSSEAISKVVEMEEIAGDIGRFNYI